MGVGADVFFDIMLSKHPHSNLGFVMARTDKGLLNSLSALSLITFHRLLVDFFFFQFNCDRVIRLPAYYHRDPSELCHGVVPHYCEQGFSQLHPRRSLGYLNSFTQLNTYKQSRGYQSTVLHNIFLKFQPTRRMPESIRHARSLGPTNDYISFKLLLWKSPPYTHR